LQDGTGVINYSRAVQSPDQRLRVMARILGYVVPTLAAPRAVFAKLGADARVDTVVAWAPRPDTTARRQLYLDDYADGDPLAATRFAGTAHTVATIEDVGGRARFESTPYGEFLAGGGSTLVGAMYLRHHGRIVATVGLLRDVDASGLSADEVAAARRLQPLIETTYACSLQIPAAPTREDLFDAASLTVRERDVVRLAALGARNAEIASALCLSVATVKVHMHHAFEKLEVHSRAELAARLQAASRTR
jgi:DNA-binding CsgD family transcriptional regulator